MLLQGVYRELKLFVLLGDRLLQLTDGLTTLVYYLLQLTWVLSQFLYLFLTHVLKKTVKVNS